MDEPGRPVHLAPEHGRQNAGMELVDRVTRLEHRQPVTSTIRPSTVRDSSLDIRGRFVCYRVSYRNPVATLIRCDTVCKCALTLNPLIVSHLLS